MKAVSEARRVLEQEEGDKLIDREDINGEALKRAEIRRKNSFRRVGATHSPRYGERLTTDSDAHLAARRKAAPQRCAISDEPKEVGHPTK